MTTTKHAFLHFVELAAIHCALQDIPSKRPVGKFLTESQLAEVKNLKSDEIATDLVPKYWLRRAHYP